MQSVPITTEVVSSNPPRLGFSAQRLYDKVSKWLAAGRWFYPGCPISSTNKTDSRDITEIVLKVALYSIMHNPLPSRGLCGLVPGNIHQYPNVMTSQLIRYARDCAQSSDFLDIPQWWTQKLLNHGYVSPVYVL